MSRVDIRRELQEAGFEFVRQANHGEFWTNGAARIMVSNTNLKAGDPSHLEALRRDIRKAVAKKNMQDRPMATLGDAMRAARDPIRKIIPRGPHPSWVACPELPKKEDAMTCGNPNWKRHTPETRERIHSLVKLGVQSGASHEAIAAELEKQGIKTVLGAPFSYSSVRAYVKKLGLSEPRKKPAAPVVARPAPKVEVKAVNKRKLPGWVIAILTDPELTPSERIDMVLQLAET